MLVEWLDPAVLELPEDESIINTFAGRIDGGRDGALVLTTTAMVFVHRARRFLRAPRQLVAWRIPLAAISGTTVAGSDLVLEHGAARTTVRIDDRHLRWIHRPGFPWAFMSGVRPPRELVDPPPYERRANTAAAPDDPRLGLVDEAARPILLAWGTMATSCSVFPDVRWIGDVARAPIEWERVVEILYIADGRGDGPAWILVARLADARWVYFAHHLQITGDVFTVTAVARTLEELWWSALTEDDRDRVAVQMIADRRDDELVQIDLRLVSEDPTVRAAAERRAIARRDAGW